MDAEARRKLRERCEALAKAEEAQAKCPDFSQDLTNEVEARILDLGAPARTAIPALLDALEKAEARVSFMETQCQCMAACTDYDLHSDVKVP